MRPMTEQATISQPLFTQARAEPQTAPILIRSSEALGWDGLVVREYDEPSELDGWQETVEPDPILMMVSQGSMQVGYYRNGNWVTVPFDQGDLSLRPGGSVSSPVRWRSCSPGPLQTVHLHLRQQLLCRTAEELGCHAPTRLNLVRRGGFQDPLMSQIGFALRRELALQAPSGKLYAETAARMLAVHLLRHYTSTPVDIPEQTQGLTSQQMRRVMGFLAEHLHEDLSLETLAEQSGFSAYHFARLFRQATGESPHQFVLRQRVRQAQRLLRETDLPPAHIAAACGFANQSHLTQVFKRYFGHTPHAYRRKR